MHSPRMTHQNCIQGPSTSSTTNVIPPVQDATQANAGANVLEHQTGACFAVTHKLAEACPPYLLAGVLHLTLEPKRRKKKALKWADDTVDNEGMGKKSSKSTAATCHPA